MLLRELRQPQRGATKRPGGTGRGAAAAPHRPHDAGRSPRGQRGAVHGQVPGAVGPLRAGTRGDQPGQRARERGLRAGPPPLQGGGRPSAVAARQSRLYQPPGLPAVPARGDDAPQRGPARTAGRGTGAVAAVAGGAVGSGGAATGEGRPGQHHPRQAQHLFGAGAADRRGGGGAGRGRAGRGLVRGGAGADDGTAARPGEASHRLSPHQQLAGAQAGGLRPLRVPRGPVSDGDLPPGLRRAPRPAAGAGGQGVRAAVAPGDPGGGGQGRGGRGGLVGGRAAADRAGGAGALGRRDAVDTGGAAGRAGGGPAAVRRAPGRRGDRME